MPSAYYNRYIPLMALLLLMIMSHTLSAQQSRPSSPVLEHLVRKPLVPTAHPPMLVLLHGFGSNEHDLMSLSASMPDDWLVVSVRGPIALGGNSHCWYHVAQQEGRIIMDAAEEKESRSMILALVDQLVQEYNADTNCIVVAGFSQGSNMALSCALTSTGRFKGFACFSGRLPDEIRQLITPSDVFSRMTAFVSHGKNDHLLPVIHAAESMRFLKGLGISVTYTEDMNEHSISPKQLTEFVQWLERI